MDIGEKEEETRREERTGCKVVQNRGQFTFFFFLLWILERPQQGVAEGETKTKERRV